MSPGRTFLNWWARQDLNLGPTDYESAALTAELRAPRLLPHLTVKQLAGHVERPFDFDQMSRC